jgi:hypothetical protein
MTTIHVTLELFQGHINDVKVHEKEHTAQLAEQRWLKENRIKNQIDREAKAQNGNEFQVFECTIKP